MKNEFKSGISTIIGKTKTAVVIGGGPIGLMCALTLKKTVPTSKVIVLEARKDSSVLNQALRLNGDTLKTIQSLKPPNGIDIVSCDAKRNGSVVISIMELCKALISWCQSSDIAILFGCVVKWIIPFGSQTLLQCHQRCSIVTNYVIFATGYNSGVPPNVYGTSPYKYSPLVGHAVVGVAKIPVGTLVDKEGAEQCSKMKTFDESSDWFPIGLKSNSMDSKFHVFINNTYGYLTVAVGCKGNKIRDWNESLKSKVNITPYDIEENRLQICIFDSDQPTLDFVWNLLYDGLRRGDETIVAGCAILLEWKDKILLVKRICPNISCPDTQFLDLFDTDILTRDSRPLFRLRIRAEIRNDKYLGGKGVPWKEQTWWINFIACKTTAFPIVQEMDEFEEEYSPIKVNSIPRPKLINDFLQPVTNISNPDSFVRCAPPFVLSTPIEITEFHKLTESSDSEISGVNNQTGESVNNDLDSSESEYDNIGFVRVVEELSAKSLSRLDVTKSDLISFLRNACSNIMPNWKFSTVEFNSIEPVSICVRVLPKCAIRFKETIIVAHGDCARSPNFFSASGVNIAAKGLDSIGGSWIQFCDGEDLDKVTATLNDMGKKLNDDILSGHEHVFMSNKVQKQSNTKYGKWNKKTDKKSVEPSLDLEKKERLERLLEREKKEKEERENRNNSSGMS